MKLSVDVDLALCDVACQVRDGVSDICREKEYNSIMACGGRQQEERERGREGERERGREGVSE